MYNQDHIDVFESIIETQEAKHYAFRVLAELCATSTASERGAIRNALTKVKFTNEVSKRLFKEVISEYISSAHEQINKAQSELKNKQKLEQPKEAKIKQICKSIMSSATINQLSLAETSFVSQITNKRKLSEKQAKWLERIALKTTVTIEGEIPLKAYDRLNTTIDHCDHQDLGSLGFQHG